MTKKRIFQKRHEEGRHIMQITEQFILMQAPNSAAEKNGRKLSKEGNFGALGRTEDGNTYWGECAGSGSRPYRVSADFALNPEQPTYRCSCPSRQFPCKHALGLMFEILAGKAFAVGDMPADLAEKKPGRRPKRPRRTKPKVRAAPNQRSPAKPTPPHRKRSWKSSLRGWIWGKK